MSRINLKETLGAESIRDDVVNECVQLIDAQVSAKSGFSGVAIKGAYGTIKRIKKGFVHATVDGMLDDWMDKIQVFYDAWDDGGKSVPLTAHLTSRSGEVAEALLEVTDDRAKRTSYKTAKKAYEKLRGSAKNNVMEAVPELGRMLERRIAEQASA